MKRQTALLAAVALAGSAAFAQDYPGREIHTVVPASAGSGGDILTRYYAEKLARITGKPVVVENKGGAQGVVGTEYAAHAKPDGHTVLFTPASSMLAAQPYFFKKLPFDPFNDFAPVMAIAWLPFGIAVDIKNPAKNINELVAALKKKSEHGFYGAGSNSGIATAELFKEMAGLQTVQVPYKGSPQGVLGLSGGQIDFLVWDATVLAGLAKGGRLRLVAVTSPRRSSTFPDVATMGESGFAGFNITSWWGVAVPAGTPRPIIDKLNSWLREINAMPETKTFLFNVATEVMVDGTPEQMGTMLKEEYERWGKLARLAKIEPQ